MKKWLLLLHLSACSFLLNGMPDPCCTGDSLNYLTLQDTIFLKSGLYSQKVFEHHIAPKQTLFSLAAFYGLTLNELYFYNPGLKNLDYNIGDPINIPIPNRAIKRFKPVVYLDTEHIPVYYVVQRGDNLFHISKRLFNLPVDLLMARNNLYEKTIYSGQKIMVGWMSVNGIPDSLRQFHGHPLWKKSIDFAKLYQFSLPTQKETLKNGAAVWDKNVKSGMELFALHRKAKTGSIVAVTNPMKKRTVYAKVVGKIPRTMDPNVEIVISPTVAKMLGAIDEKFYVKVRYLQ